MTSESFHGHETVMVADDEPIVLSLVGTVLQNHGYRVIEAPGGPEALDLHSRCGAVDLLVTDVLMPAISGPELVHELRKTDAELKCIFMSGYDPKQLDEKGPVPGCDYLRKPFTPRQLLKKVRETLDAESERD